MIDIGEITNDSINLLDLYLLFSIWVSISAGYLFDKQIFQIVSKKFSMIYLVIFYCFFSNLYYKLLFLMAKEKWASNSLSMIYTIIVSVVWGYPYYKFLWWIGSKEFTMDPDEIMKIRLETLYWRFTVIFFIVDFYAVFGVYGDSSFLKAVYREDNNGVNEIA